MTSTPQFAAPEGLLAACVTGGLAASVDPDIVVYGCDETSSTDLGSGGLFRTIVRLSAETRADAEFAPPVRRFLEIDEAGSRSVEAVAASVGYSLAVRVVKLATDYEMRRLAAPEEVSWGELKLRLLGAVALTSSASKSLGIVGSETAAPSVNQHILSALDARMRSRRNIEDVAALRRALADVRHFLADSPPLPLPRCSVGSDGEIVLEWRDGERHALVSFEGDQSFGYTFRLGQGFVPGEAEGRIPGGAPADLVAYLKEF
ncbi:hypothetical protein XFLAVUS301_30990 [Xanthobacter flavus]|nr:hypothetical protein XFLAVUS301_30990 [Xanthobacter flavus]